MNEAVGLGVGIIQMEDLSGISENDTSSIASIELIFSIEINLNPFRFLNLSITRRCSFRFLDK